MTLLFELRPLLIGLWGVVFDWTLVVGERYTGRWGARGAAVATLVVVLPNLALATPVPDRFALYAALQVTSAVATATVGAGSTGSIARSSVVSPRHWSSWSSPLRRQFVFLTVLEAVRTHGPAGCPRRVLPPPYARGRRRCPSTQLRFYSTIGGMAWIHAGERLVLFIALVCGDVAATRAFRSRDIEVAVVATAASLLRFFHQPPDRREPAALPTGADWVRRTVRRRWGIAR